MQFAQDKRASSSYKKGQYCDNRITSKCAESSNLNRKNLTLRKIIETLTHKVNDVNAEQSIYGYLDIIDHNGPDPHFSKLSQAESIVN